MRIATVSDLHIGNFPKFGGAYVSGINARCAASLQSLARAVAVANKHGCEHFVVNGDVFDTDTPSPQVEAAVISALRSFNGDVHLIVGNHDQRSTAEGDHALGPLDKHRTEGGEIVVHEVPGSYTWLGAETRDVLFAPYNQDPVAEWFPKLLRVHRPHIVFAHFGVIDHRTPAFLRQSSSDACDWETLRNAMNAVGTRLLCVGNWHDPGTWESGGARIEQIGALTPTGFDNLGPAFGRVLIADTASLETKAVRVAGPRFVKLVWGSDLLNQISGHGKHVYAHMEAEPSELTAARAWLKGPGSQVGIKDYTLVPSKVAAVNQARSAARAVVQASTMREAIESYIAKMPVPESVDRAAVSARVQGYLKTVGGLNE